MMRVMQLVIKQMMKVVLAAVTEGANAIKGKNATNITREIDPTNTTEAGTTAKKKDATKNITITNITKRARNTTTDTMIAIENIVIEKIVLALDHHPLHLLHFHLIPNIPIKLNPIVGTITPTKIHPAAHFRDQDRHPAEHHRIVAALILDHLCQRDPIPNHTTTTTIVKERNHAKILDHHALDPILDHLVHGLGRRTIMIVEIINRIMMYVLDATAGAAVAVAVIAVVHPVLNNLPTLQTWRKQG